jgi:septum formation inhibitor-activating ATPase MinD
MANNEGFIYIDKTDSSNIIRRFRVERVHRIVPKNTLEMQDTEPPLMVDSGSILASDETIVINGNEGIAPVGPAAIAGVTLQSMKDIVKDREEHALKPKPFKKK